MAKRLNKNLVVVLTIVGMLLTTAAGVILVNSLPQKSPQVFVDEAEKALAKSPPEYAQASSYYQRAAGRAKAAGDDLAANEYMIKAGDMALAAGDANRAMNLWNTVVIADPSQMAAQEKIVSFTLELAQMGNSTDWWARLQTQAQKLVDAAEKARTKNYVALHALGRALLAQSRVRETNKEEGRKYLTEAFNGDKGNAEYARSLAGYYLLDAQLDKSATPNIQAIKDAVAVFDTAIANAPDDPEKKAKAYLYRGQFYAIPAVALVFPADADQKALADLEEAVRLAPKNEEAIVGLGAFWHAKMQNAARTKAPPDQIDEYGRKALEQYKRAIEADPDHYLGYLQLASFYMEGKHYDDAIAVLNRRLERPVDRYRYDYWRSRQYMLTVRETAFKANMARYTELLQAAASPDEAKKLTAPVKKRLEEIRDKTRAENGEDDPIALFMQGRLLFLEGEPHAAVKVLRRTEDLTRGDTPEIQRFLAILYAQIGSAGAAQAALDVVLAAAPNDEASLVLQANIKNQLGQPEEALIAADRALAVNPQSTDALRAKAQAYAQQKNYAALSQITAQLNTGASAAQDSFVRAVLLRQEAASANPPDQAKLTQAAALLQQILKDDPLHYSALVQLVGILGARPEGLADARRALDESRRAIEKKLSEVSATQPAGTNAQELARELINIDLMGVTIDPSVPPEDKLKRKEEIVRQEKDPFTVAMALFQLYSRSEPPHPDQALTHLKEAYRLKPDDPNVLEAMLNAAIEVKDWKLAEEVVDKAVAAGVEKSGGHMYRGMIWLARSDRPNHLVEAEKEFRAVLVEIPEFADAYAQLGRALLAQNRLDEARAAFENAYRNNPRNPYSPVGLAIIAESQGNQDEKRKWLEIAFRVAPGNLWVQRHLREQEENLDPQKGIARREADRKSNPGDLDNLVRLADLYIKVNNLEQADKVYQAAMEAAPTNLRLAGMYAQFLAGKQPPDIPGARSMLEKFVQGIDPKEADLKAAAQLLFASFLRGISNPGVENAPTLQEVDAAFLAAPAISSSMVVQSDVAAHYLQTGRPADAMKWYRGARDSADRAGKDDQRKVAHQLIVQTLLQTASPDNFQELRTEIASYRQRYPEDAAGNMMQAELDTILGHEPQAIKQFSEFISRMPDRPLGYCKRGIAYYRRSDWDAAIKDFRESKRLDPTYLNGYPRLLLARSLEQSGQTDSAVAELQSLTEQIPTNGDAAEELFALYVRLKRFDSAESLIRARSQSNPDLPFWSDLRRRIAMERKDYDGALRHALAAVEQTQYAPMALDGYLLLLLQLNRFDQLIAYVEQKLPAQHRKDAVLVRLASAYLAKNDENKALELYFEAVSTPPVDVLVLSDFLAHDAQYKQHHPSLLKRLEAMWQERKDRNVRLLLSSVYRTAGNYAGAADLLREMLETAAADTPEQQNEQLALNRSMATLLYEAKQWDAARQYYLKVLEKHPNDAVALNNLAYLLMDQMNQAQEALTYSQRANSVIPDASPQKGSVLDTLGWNLVLLGRHDEAISRLGRSIEIDPRIPSVHYHLAEALYGRSRNAPTDVAQGDIEQAKKEVQTAHQLLVQAGQDTENVSGRLTALAEKLGVTLTGPAPTTQATR